jgi:CubicO group peptidase (beta-lactamase class C family)
MAIATDSTRRSVAVGLDKVGLRARIAQVLNRHPAVGFALGVIVDGRLELFYAHGQARIAPSTPITEDTIFRVASITKTFTAIAAMQLWERGLVDLDAPANDYLRAYKLTPAKPGGATASLRQLMTHTSGIPEMVHLGHSLRYLYGTSYGLDERVPALADYYRGGLRLATEPGATFRYTDHNFSTVGQIVEDVSGEPLDRYLRDHVFKPLGMADTDLQRSDAVRSRLATGYNLGSGAPKPVIDRQWLTAAASMAYSSSKDMARYVAALLGGGTNEFGSVLKPETVAMMFAPQYQPDPRIPGIGLAFDRFSVGGHPVIGHEGVLPGFNSQIFAAPDAGVGVMAFTNGARGAMFWLPADLMSLLSFVLGVPEDGIKTDVPQHPEIWRELCGWYPFSGPLTDTRARSIFGLGAEVLVRRGRLMIRALSPMPTVFRGFALHPDDEKDPLAFRIDMSKYGVASARVVFSGAGTTTPTRVHLDVLPMSLEKRPSSSNPRPWIAAGLTALGVAASVAALRRRR